MKTKTKTLCEVLKMMESMGVELERGRLARMWKLSELDLPACVSGLEEGGCMGCRKANGLYLQCVKKVKGGSKFCTSCERSFVSEGRPRHGLYSERISQENWKDEEGKAPKSWLSYLMSQGVSREDGESFMESKNVDVSKIPDKEWLMGKKKSGRPRSIVGVSDTDSEGGSFTSRFIPVDGKRKSPPKEKAHKGQNGAYLRVHYFKETGVVAKVNIQNWTDAANAKFAELYCEGEMGKDQGKEYSKATKKKSKKKGDDQLAEMQAKFEADAKAQADEIAALKAQLAQRNEEDVVPIAEVTAPEVTPAPEVSATPLPAPEVAQPAPKIDKAAKKKKQEALKKARAEKKASELKRKMKEAEEAAEKKKEEEMAALKAQLEAEQNDEEDDAGFSDDDNEEHEFNPFKHNDTTYHRDEEDSLYTEDGDYWGYINEDNEVIEGDR